MTAKCAMILQLLEGKVISVNTAFYKFGITNLSREIPRSVEHKKSKQHPNATGFDVTVSRVKKTGKSEYGTPIYWFEYRLNRSPHNEPGREKMVAYCKEQMKKLPPPKTTQLKKIYRQTDLFLASQ